MVVISTTIILYTIFLICKGEFLTNNRKIKNNFYANRKKLT